MSRAGHLQTYRQTGVVGAAGQRQDEVAVLHQIALNIDRIDAVEPCVADVLDAHRGGRPQEGGEGALAVGRDEGRGHTRRQRRRGQVEVRAGRRKTVGEEGTVGVGAHLARHSRGHAQMSQRHDGVAGRAARRAVTLVGGHARRDGLKRGLVNELHRALRQGKLSEEGIGNARIEGVNKGVAYAQNHFLHI